MLVTIQEFRDRIQGDCDGLVRELQALTGRTGDEEAKAWRSSLPTLSQAFADPAFQSLHLYFGSRGNLSLEYQLPASSSWCDVVLLGAHDSKPSAVIIELKDWTIQSDKPGRYEGLVEHQGSEVLHPSDQVRGYVEYCRNFHSTVSAYGASVHGCILFTRDIWKDAYVSAPNDKLVGEYPVFSIHRDDVSHRFPEFFKSRLCDPHEQFARAFEEGEYRQSRGFVAQIGKQILKPESKLFELLNGQRTAFSVCRGVIRDLVGSQSGESLRKRVVVIIGPPGSGKSAIAAKLWASLVTDEQFPDGNVVFTTTSLSQNSNWGQLFINAAMDHGAQGVVRKASAYTPLSTQKVGQLRKKKGKRFISDAKQWRSNLITLQTIRVKWRQGAKDNENLVTIVDEAHGLINPEHPEGRGQFGFAPTLGPQAYHIIRSSVVSVFLLDPDQGFRRRENTTLEDIKKWSHELGAGEPELISLENAQFRCAGSPEYVQWVESLLNGKSAKTNSQIAAHWRRERAPFTVLENHAKYDQPKAAEPPGIYDFALNPDDRKRLDFRVFDDPETMENSLRELIAGKASARLLSSYSRPWATEKAARPHQLPAKDMDFHEKYVRGGKNLMWSRIWNYVPNKGNDYTWYVTAHPAGHIFKDPLCEVGCPYAVRGFDYDYVGILWLNDLKWRNGRWLIDPKAVEERGFAGLIRQAREEVARGQEGTAYEELQKRIVQAYRILFTRALKGVFVWVPDPETRQHLMDSVSSPEALNPI